MSTFKISILVEVSKIFVDMTLVHLGHYL